MPGKLRLGLLCLLISRSLLSDWFHHSDEDQWGKCQACQPTDEEYPAPVEDLCDAIADGIGQTVPDVYAPVVDAERRATQLLNV